MSSIFAMEAANFLAFVGAKRPKLDSVFILIMGMTGSGKSSFIADCTGREDARIGHDLASCTSSVAIFRSELQGRDVYLIDTPGFDDTNREDVEILTAVAHYLSVSYANNVSINGVLYLHSISNTRVGFSTRRNLEMMKALCGEESFENIAVVTTMWSSDQSEIEHAKQCKKEQQLRDMYLHDMLEKGSQIISHSEFQTLSERRASAKKILARMFDIWKDTQITLQIQHEMVDLNLTLNESSAGKLLEQDLNESQQSCEKQLDRLKISQGKNGRLEDKLVHTQLEQQDSDIRITLAESNQALDAMRLSLLEIHQKQSERFFEQVSAMQRQWKETLGQKEEEYRRKEREYLDRHMSKREEYLNQRERDKQEHHDSSEALVVAQSAFAYEREAYGELARQGYRQLTELQELNAQQHKELRKFKHRDRLLEVELEELRLEVQDLKLETQSKLDTTEKVKHEWSGPLIQGLVTGGLGVVGTCITAGMLCCVQ